MYAPIKEEIFYPAAYDPLDDDDLLDARVTVLGDYVAHQFEEEKKDMVPQYWASDLDLKARMQMAC